MQETLNVVTRVQRSGAIVVGASAGAFDALSIVLSKLPGDYGLPLMVVVHVPPDAKSMMAELLQIHCKITVKEAEDKEPIEPGVVYFAPPDYHLLVERNRRLSLSSEEPVWFSRPSIDILFESAADTYGSELVGIVLTGASHDGASGSRSIQAAGGAVLVQRPDQAHASIMPQAALDACSKARALSLEEIATHLLEVVA